MSDREARAGLRALLMGQLVLSKEESEQLLSVLLGGNDLTNGSILRLDITWVKDNEGKLHLIDSRRTVQQQPRSLVDLPVRMVFPIDEVDQANGFPDLSAPRQTIYPARQHLTSDVGNCQPECWCNQ
jgi:hypothetical protein